MIFNTFENNDIDKWTAKIGIFGKSFNELGTAIDSAFKTYIDNIDNFDKDISFWDALKENLFSKDDNWIKNSLGEIVSKDNIDSYIEELDLDSAKEKVEEIFNFSTQKGDKGWQDYFNTLDDGEGYIVDVIKSTDDLSKLTGEELVAANQKARASAIAHNAALKQQTLGAKAANIAIKGLALAGNMLVSLGISAIISLAVKGLDNLVHAADNAKESTESFSNSFKSMNDEFSSNDSKLSDLQKQYDELSKGVNSLGENVSLTTNEYSTYKQVISEISDMMPDLLARYDEEGNKIGFVQGKLKDLSTEYDNYKKKKAMKLINGENDDGDSVKDVFNNYQYQTAHTDVNGNIVGKRKMFGDSNYEKILTLQSEIDSGYDGIFGKHELTNEDIEEKTALIQKYQSEIDVSVSAIQDAISAIAQSGNEYYKLSDQEQQFLDTYINSLSQDFIDKNNLTNETNARSFINNLINEIKSGKPEIMKAYNDLFSFNINDTELNPEEVQKKVDELIQQLAKALGEDDWQDLKIRLGFEFVDDNVKNYESTINHFKDQFGEKGYQIIADFFNTEGINTQDELDKFNKVTDGITDADLAIQRWNEHKKEFGEASDLSEFLSENKKLEKQLIQLSKVGKLDTETIQSLDDYDKLLSLCGNDADSLITKLKKLSDESNTTFDATNNLDTITGGLDSLSEVYSQAMNDGFVDSDALASLYDQFGDLSVFEDFAKAMQNIGEAGYDSAQSFNDLADAYINAKLPLSDLTEATKKQYIAELEKNGVENAEEAITGRLNYITTVRKNAIESLANTQEYANTTTEDLANATFEEITQMINAAEASGADTKALGLLAAAKIQSNANQLNESTTIEQLIDAAQAAGVGAVAIESYNHTKNYLHGQDLENYTKSFKERLLKELNDIKIDFPKYKYNGVSPKTKSDSGKSASDSAKEAQDTSKQYDWIAIAIQRCEEAITSLDRAEGNTYEWWSKRNKALLEEINQTAREIELLQYSYNGYMDAANAVGLSDDYKQKVINGTIQIETVTDENLQKKIDEFQQWWEKARDCKDKIDELNISLSKLAQQKFDNIVFHFEEREKAFTGLNDILDAQVKLAEAKGQIVSRKYYDAMIKNEQSNNKLLVQQRDQMVKSLNEAVSSGKIQQGSEAWSDMQARINEINKAIIESNTSLQEFQNSIRQLEWDKFDRLIEEIQDVADEIDWVSSLLKDDDLTDGKSNRGLTDKGNAKMGSYASMYNLYLAESQKYASEIKKIDKELAKDPYNQDLIDRKKELIKAQRDAISSAEDEKDAMIDLARKGYDAILESLQDLIDKKKEALESEKD